MRESNLKLGSMLLFFLGSSQFRQLRHQAPPMQGPCWRVTVTAATNKVVKAIFCQGWHMVRHTIQPLNSDTQVLIWTLYHDYCQSLFSSVCYLDTSLTFSYLPTIPNSSSHYTKPNIREIFLGQGTKNFFFALVSILPIFRISFWGKKRSKSKDLTFFT